MSRAYPCPVRVHRWLVRNRTFVIVATILVALSAVGAGLFVHAHVSLLRRSFEERSLAYVQAFAAAAESWSERGDVEMLRSAAQLLLAGSPIYVQVADSARLLVDERSPEAQGLEIPPPAEALSGSLLRRPPASQGSHLEILAPLPSGTGYVRVGIDHSSVAAQTATAAGIATAAVVGFDALLILSFALLRRERRTREASQETAHADQQAEPTLRRAGPLVVDPIRKAVRVFEHPVRLTPKQFALLELLAREPGRVFSEREILEAAWPNSAYADSKDIKQYVYLVRKKLSQADEAARELIETVPGFGYRLAVDREMTEP